MDIEELDNNYNTPDYFDEDENEIDWDERLFGGMDDETPDDTEETDESDEPEEVKVKVDDRGYLTPLLTERYIKSQLVKPEYNRDRIKFYYKNEVVYGHILMVTKSEKYIFDLVDLSTGIHITKALDGNYIDSF